MPSRIYLLFERAMRERRPLVCMYDGHPRAVCPIVLGHTDGVEKALTWQFDGAGSDGPVRGEWKCFHLDKIEQAGIADGPWRAGSSHRTSQTCVKDVDLDVNPDSPFNPRRRLPDL